MDDQHTTERDNSAANRAELFNKYVYPHRNLIYKLCMKYSFNPQDVPDNYAEVLINFFKYIHTYDQSRSVQTWLHIVTKRLVYDRDCRRAAFKRSEDVDISEIVDEYTDGEHVSGNCMGIDNYRQFYNDDILRALDSIKPIYREALLLQQAGYKLEEIMEISYRNGNLKTRNLETVKSRLFLAKQNMRRLITRDGDAKKGDL